MKKTKTKKVKMRMSNSPWFKATLAVFSVSVVGAAIAAFSFASDASTLHGSAPVEPIPSVSRVATHEAMPAPKLVTQDMIQDRTASCAEMISPKDKVRCLNKRLQMKKELLTQEKWKCDQLEGKSGKVQCFVELDTLKKGLRSV
jgi:hypothetical protein